MDIVNLHYLPAIHFFAAIVKQEKIVIEHFDSFQKSTFRNKTAIATANGKLTLSIPIDGGRNNRELYRDVQISNIEKWQHKHYLAIVSAYQNAPYFDFYIDKFHPFYHTTQHSLFEFNLGIFKLCLKLLKLDIPLSFSEDFMPKENHINQLNKENTLLQLPPNPRYIQVFEEKNGFISHLSILDLLMNKGNTALRYLQEM